MSRARSCSRVRRWHRGSWESPRRASPSGITCRPMLIAVQDGIGKGSARSAGKVNVKEALERCSEHLIEFGGHKEAGGFSIREEAIPDFQVMFEEVVVELSAGPAAPCVFKVDAEIPLGECTLELYLVHRAARTVRRGESGAGSHDSAISRCFRARESSGTGISRSKRATGTRTRAISSDSRSRARGSPPTSSARRIDVLINLRKNTYQGRVEPQLQIAAIRFSGSAQGAGASPAC